MFETMKATLAYFFYDVETTQLIMKYRKLVVSLQITPTNKVRLENLVA